MSPTAAFGKINQDVQDHSKKFKKRQRSPSGISNASSTTAEPLRKVVPTAEVAETVSIGSNDSEKSSKAKRSLSNLFGTSKSKRKSKEDQLRKTSTTASLLHGALTLNPDFHKAIVEYNNVSPAAKPAGQQQQVTLRVSPPPAEHVMGTVLRPQLPRGRTPFQAWLPDGYSRIFRIVHVWPSGLLDYGSATLRCKI